MKATFVSYAVLACVPLTKGFADRLTLDSYVIESGNLLEH